MGGLVPDAEAHTAEAPSASRQAAESTMAAGAWQWDTVVIDVCLSCSCSAQDVSVCLQMTFWGLAAPSIVPLLLPPESLHFSLDGLKPIQT